MRQAIVTKYLSPTNTRGARVKATAQAGSVTIPWDHALNSEDNHTEAARRLMERYSWHTKNDMRGGASPNGKGYCFVLIEKE